MYSSGSQLQFRQQSRYPKPKSGDNENMRCDVCSISLKGQDQLNSHLTGAKHAKKLKEQENSKKIEEIPCLRSDDNSGKYECTICKVSLNSSSVAMFHVLGSRHQETAKAIKTVETPEAAPVATEKSNGSAASEQVTKTEQNDQPSSQQDCTPQGKSALPPARASCRPFRPNFNRPRFIPNANHTNMRPHLGPRFRYMCKPLASSFVSKYTLHTVEASVPTWMNSAPRPRFPPAAGPGPKTFPCLACNIITNSEQQLQAHLSSEKHKTRLGPSGGQTIVPPPPVTMSALRCESCNISVNSQMQLDQHLQSPKHRNKLRMRFQPY